MAMAISGARRLRWSVRGVALTLAAFIAVYLWGLSADRYVSEARFVVRTGAAALSDDEGNLLSTVGGQVTSDDTFAIHDFILSRDMLSRIMGRIDLRSLFAKGGLDFIYDYPSLFHGKSQEELFLHYKMFVSVQYNSSTGVSTLHIEAFTPQDAHALASAILEESEVFINDLNSRSRLDAVRDARATLQEARERLIAAQTDLAIFRSRELILDPDKTSYLVLELVGRLSETLAEMRTQIRNLEQTAPSSPQLPAMRRRAAALEQQIQNERERIASQSDGLAEKIAVFERLSVDHDLAVKTAASAFKSLSVARIQANRQQIYLQQIVEPNFPDYAVRPRRMMIFLGSAFLLAIGALVAWMLYTGLREHSAGRLRPMS